MFGRLLDARFAWLRSGASLQRQTMEIPQTATDADLLAILEKVLASADFRNGDLEKHSKPTEKTIGVYRFKRV